MSRESPGPKIGNAEFIAASATLEGLPPPVYAEIAFAGRSNVGKSSLINSLVQRKKLARTSSTPGCTRGLVLFRITLRDPDRIVDFVDLPGYGYAKRSKAERKSWGTTIEEFLEHRPGLGGVVVLIDARRGLQPDDEQLLEFLRSIKQRAIPVATKIDKLAARDRKPCLAELGRACRTRVIGSSAMTGEGRNALWESLLAPRE